MKTATTIAVLTLAAIMIALPAVAGDPPSDPGQGNAPDGKSGGGSCITLVLQQTPPVMIDPDACLPVHD